MVNAGTNPANCGPGARVQRRQRLSIDEEQTRLMTRLTGEPTERGCDAQAAQTRSRNADYSEPTKRR
jgi:hypothetical protein